MFLRIQRGSATPISRQIDAQIREQILSGVLAADEQLPSVRQLARQLAVNVNTVFRVYERLAADGLIDLRHGDGTYVAPRRKSAVHTQLARRREEFALELDALVRRGLLLGLKPRELVQALEQAIARAKVDTVAASPSVSSERSS